MSESLSYEKINSGLKDLPGWSFAEDKIEKTYKLNSFSEAISFVVRMAFEAEDLDHHPELYNVYNRVKISLQTHDAGGKVTAKDIELAQRIEQLARTD